ncbi:hypothetical protein HDU86_003819 [Geranomyces michiganensis]|nr:hypothetical protein HDU86_003819 [Geranomyces michiganensis]
MESTARYPTPQTLIALIEQSQQMLNRVRQLQPSASNRPEDTAAAFAKVHDNVRAMRKHVVDSRTRILDDPVLALQQEIQQLQTNNRRKSAAVDSYSHFFDTWQQTLNKISSTTNTALARSYRDDTLIPPNPPAASSTDASAAEYALLDDVNDNPYVVGGDDAAALLLPLASPLDGTQVAGKMILPTTTAASTAAIGVTLADEAVLDSGFGVGGGGFAGVELTSADDFLGSSMDTFTGSGTAGTQNLQLQLQMPSQPNSQAPPELFNIFGGNGDGGGSSSQFSTSGMMDSTDGLNPFAGIGEGAVPMGSSAASQDAGLPMGGVSDTNMDSLFALNGSRHWSGDTGADTLLPTSEIPVTSFAGAPPSTIAAAQPLDPAAPEAVVDLGDGFFDDFLVED